MPHFLPIDSPFPPLKAVEAKAENKQEERVKMQNISLTQEYLVNLFSL